jgi:DNA modification methylase
MSNIGMPDIAKPLKIPHQKTCDCPEFHISCVTPKEWMKGMITIQSFAYEARDIRDKNLHPAMFPIALPAHFIRLLTHRGELVLDPFVGAGSTLIAAQDLERNAVGFDLQQKYVDISTATTELLARNDRTRQVAIADDAHNIPQYLEEKTVALSVSSPPYPHFLTRKRKNKSTRSDERENEHYDQIQQYSSDPRDLGLMNHDDYEEALNGIYSGILSLMKPKAHVIVNVNDLWLDNRRYPTHISVIHALTKAGLEFRNTFIWDKRNLVNRVGIFGWPNNFISLSTTMEYLLDFRRPG